MNNSKNDSKQNVKDANYDYIINKNNLAHFWETRLLQERDMTKIRMWQTKKHFPFGGSTSPILARPTRCETHLWATHNRNFSLTKNHSLSWYPSAISINSSNEHHEFTA